VQQPATQGVTSVVRVEGRAVTNRARPEPTRPVEAVALHHDFTHHGPRPVNDGALDHDLSHDGGRAVDHRTLDDYLPRDTAGWSDHPALDDSPPGHYGFRRIVGAVAIPTCLSGLGIEKRPCSKHDRSKGKKY